MRNDKVTEWEDARLSGTGRDSPHRFANCSGHHSCARASRDHEKFTLNFVLPWQRVHHAWSRLAQRAKTGVRSHANHPKRAVRTGLGFAVSVPVLSSRIDKTP